MRCRNRGWRQRQRGRTPSPAPGQRGATRQSGVRPPATSHRLRARTTGAKVRPLFPCQRRKILRRAPKAPLLTGTSAPASTCGSKLPLAHLTLHTFLALNDSELHVHSHARGSYVLGRSVSTAVSSGEFAGFCSAP